MKRRGAVAIALVIALAAIGVSAYVVGHSFAPDASDARVERQSHRTRARGLAERRAFLSKRQQMFRVGLREGRLRGKRAGRERGTAAAEREFARERGTATQTAPASPEASTPKLACDGAIADDAHYEACLRQSGDRGRLGDNGRYVPGD